MQEEVENKTLTLIVSGTKFTGRLLKAAISKYAAHRRNVKLDKQRQAGDSGSPPGQADGKAAHPPEPGGQQHRLPGQGHPPL